MKGFTNFASKIDYIFDIKNGKYQLNYKKIKNILTNSNNSLIICGFTFLVYSFFIKVLKINKKKFKFPRGSFLLHIGGWKKLEEEKVTRNTFMEASVKTLGLKYNNIVDIYGFTEQMGTIYPECSTVSNTFQTTHLIVRNPYSYEVIKNGIVGTGQFLSMVPKSYVGFSVMTDDLIKIEGYDDCPCGRKEHIFQYWEDQSLQRLEVVGML